MKEIVLQIEEIYTKAQEVYSMKRRGSRITVDPKLDYTRNSIQFDARSPYAVWSFLIDRQFGFAEAWGRKEALKQGIMTDIGFERTIIAEAAWFIANFALAVDKWQWLRENL